MNSLPKSSQRGITLVEILVVITLLAVISGMLNVAITSSQTEAKNRRCKVELLVYRQILEQRAASLSFREPQLLKPVAKLVVDGAARHPGGTKPSPLGFENGHSVRKRIVREDNQRLTLLARRDYVRMILPQCRADLFLPPVLLQQRVDDEKSGDTSVAALEMDIEITKVAVPREYDEMRRLAGLLTTVEINATAFSTAGFDTMGEFEGNAVFRDLCTSQPDRAIAWSPENESAECLYLILATTRANRQRAIDQVASRNIGDTDGDGMLEVLDPWGVPIRYLREPVGLQIPGSLTWDQTEAGTVREYPQQAEAFDLLGDDFRLLDDQNDGTLDLISASYKAPDSVSGTVQTVDSPAIAFTPIYLAPVVISAGSDGEFGIYTLEYLTSAVNPAAAGSDVYFSPSRVRLDANYVPQPKVPATGNAGTYWYPDPYISFKSFAESSTHPVPTLTAGLTGIVDAKRGGGLGAVISNENFVPLDDALEAMADNLYSTESSL